MALKIDILANTREAQRNVKDLGEELDRNADALDDLAREGDQAGEKLERSFRDMVRDVEKAEKSVDKLERTTKDVGDAGGRSFRKIGDTGSEVASELSQNLGETMSSFRGNLEDLPQIAQDTLGGLAGSGALGGIAGLAATAAGAAGLGLIIASLDAQTEAAERLRERLSSAYTQAIEDGRNYINEAQVIAELQDLMFNPDRVGEYNRLLEDQKTLGLDIEVLAGANIGRQEDLETIQKRINTLKEEGTDISRGENSLLGDIDTNLIGIENRWGGVQAETDKQKQKVAEVEAAERRLNETARAQINRTADAASRRYEGLARQYGADIRATVRYDVDDSAVRNYRPPRKLGAVQYLPSTQTDRWV